MTLRNKTIVCALLLGGLAPATPTQAQEFRRLQAIPAPSENAAAAAPVFRPVALETVEQAVEKLFESWNTPAIRTLLSAKFYEQTRLPEALVSVVPRDARLRVLAIEGISTLEQSSQPVGPEGDILRLASTVSVIVRSQLEYNDPTEGFQRSEGSNEYIFDVTELVPR